MLASLAGGWHACAEGARADMLCAQSRINAGGQATLTVFGEQRERERGRWVGLAPCWTQRVPVDVTGAMTSPVTSSPWRKKKMKVGYERRHWHNKAIIKTGRLL